MYSIIRGRAARRPRERLALGAVPRAELEDRDRPAGAAGAIAVGRKGRQDALREPEQARALLLVFDELGAEALPAERDLRVRSRVVVPRGVLGPSRLRSEDDHATAIVEIDHRVSANAPRARPARFKQSRREKQAGPEPATGEPHQVG